MRRDRGFVLVAAALMMVAVSALVAVVADISGAMRLVQVNRRAAMSAEQIAELGLTRATREVERMITEAFEQDFDRLLDPDLDGAGGANTDQLPASSTITLAAGVTMGGWGSDSTTVGGQRYRRVAIDTDGNGSNDAAYLVRYDDNRDDAPQYPTDTTGNHSMTEGPSAGGDVPLRDRDQTISITVVGLTGGIDYDSALARHTLRALYRSSGGKSVIAGRDYELAGESGNDQLCGNGAIICGDTSDLANLECFCGNIRAPSFPAGFAVNTPPPCTGCSSCAPQSLTTAACPSPPMPPVPEPVSFHTKWMNGLAGNTCYFLVYDEPPGNPLFTDEVVFIWDRDANPACQSVPAGDIPMPDLNGIVGDWPADCWMPVFDRNDAASRDRLGDEWRPGHTDGTIKPLEPEVAARAAIAGSLGAITAPTWSSYCGCTSCGAGSSPVLYDTDSESLFVHSTMPRGIYHVKLTSEALEMHYGGPQPSPMALVASVPSGSAVRFPDNDVNLQHPLGCGHERFAIVTNGGCQMAGNGLEMDWGMYCEASVDWRTQAGVSRGDLISRGSIAADNANGFTIYGGCPAGCPGMSQLWSGGNVTVKNTGDFCANIKAVGNVDAQNNTTFNGTIWSGGDMTGHNNIVVDPFDVAGSMLGSVPLLTGVQSIAH